MRVLLRSTEEVPVAALESEAMRKRSEPVNDIRDRIVDGSKVQSGNRSLPGVGVAAVFHELPGLGKRLH